MLLIKVSASWRPTPTSLPKGKFHPPKKTTEPKEEVASEPQDDQPTVHQEDQNAVQPEDDNNPFEFDEGEELKIIFEVSDPDSLDNPDKLVITHTSLGLSSLETNTDINFDLCTFDDCSFIKNDNKDETDTNNIYE